MILIMPYHRNSESAGLLKQAFRANGLVARIRTGATPWKAKRRHRLISWGHPSPPAGAINFNAHRAGNKLHAFNVMQAAGVPVPEYTTDADTAREWETALSRTLRGQSGSGIVVGVDTSKPLFVRYYAKLAEYRVHVIAGNAVYVQRKRRKNNAPRSKIWNKSAGYVFSVRHDCPAYVIDSGIAAVAALGLDFGAVDVMQYRDAPLVLEVNTAPGLCPSSAAVYASRLGELLCV